MLVLFGFFLKMKNSSFLAIFRETQISFRRLNLVFSVGFSWGLIEKKKICTYAVCTCDGYGCSEAFPGC